MPRSALQVVNMVKWKIISIKLRPLMVVSECLPYLEIWINTVNKDTQARSLSLSLSL